MTTIHQSLTSDELKEAEAVMELWEKNGLPRDMQLYKSMSKTRLVGGEVSNGSKNSLY